MAFKVSSLQHHLVLDGPELFILQNFLLQRNAFSLPTVAHGHMGAHYTLTLLCTLSVIHTQHGTRQTSRFQPGSQRSWPTNPLILSLVSADDGDCSSPL